MTDFIYFLAVISKTMNKNLYSYMRRFGSMCTTQLSQMSRLDDWLPITTHALDRASAKLQGMALLYCGKRYKERRSTGWDDRMEEVMSANVHSPRNGAYVL